MVSPQIYSRTASFVPIHSNQIMFAQDLSYSHSGRKLVHPPGPLPARRASTPEGRPLWAGGHEEHEETIKPFSYSFFVPFVCFVVKSLFPVYPATLNSRLTYLEFVE